MFCQHGAYCHVVMFLAFSVIINIRYVTGRYDDRQTNWENRHAREDNIKICFKKFCIRFGFYSLVRDRIQRPAFELL